MSGPQMGPSRRRGRRARWPPSTSAPTVASLALAATALAPPAGSASRALAIWTRKHRGHCHRLRSSLGPPAPVGPMSSEAGGSGPYACGSKSQAPGSHFPPVAPVRLQRGLVRRRSALMCSAATGLFYLAFCWDPSAGRTWTAPRQASQQVVATTVASPSLAAGTALAHRPRDAFATRSARPQVARAARRTVEEARKKDEQFEDILNELEAEIDMNVDLPQEDDPLGWWKDTFGWVLVLDVFVIIALALWFLFGVFLKYTFGFEPVLQVFVNYWDPYFQSIVSILFAARAIGIALSQVLGNTN
mmetsp:Transcript_30565/g.66663  ORF Transcript_30565/g.66663 Transcript_30565/m.66663 type:complete len:303 (+) Transcript_30565:538-1446(+)